MLCPPGMKKTDLAKYSRVLGLDGLEVMSARWVKHSFAPHMHDFTPFVSIMEDEVHSIVGVSFVMRLPAHAIS